MSQIGVSHNQAGQVRTKYLDGAITRGAAPTAPPRAGMTRLAWVDGGQPMALDIPASYVLQAAGPNAANPRAPGAGLVSVTARHFATLAAGQDLGRLEARLHADQVPSPAAGSVMFWWLEDGLAGGIEIVATAQAFQALTAPSIGSMLSGQTVGIVGGTYSIPPDSVTRRLFRTPAGGSASEVPIPYTLSALDDGAAFQPIEYPTVFGVSQGANPGELAVFTMAAPSLSSVTVTVNQVRGEATITGVPRQGDNPDSMFLGVQGQALTETLTTSLTLRLPPGTYTPVGRAVYADKVSSPVTGAAFTLFEQLVVVGDPSISGQAIVGGTLVATPPTNSGAIATAYQWLLGGVEIANATASSYSPTAAGQVTLRMRFTSSEGSTIEKTSQPVTVVAAPVAVPGRVTGLTVAPNPAGPGVIVTWQAPTSGASAADFVARVKRDDGTTPDATTAATSITVTSPIDGQTQTIQVSARNSAGQEGEAESVSMRYRASIRQGLVLSAGASVNIVRLDQVDIDHGHMTVQTLQAGAVQIKTQAGATIISATAASEVVEFPTAGITALVITGGPSWSILASPWNYRILSSGIWSSSSQRVGGIINITTLPFAENMGVLVPRYGLDVYDTAVPSSSDGTPGTWQTPPGQRSATPQIVIPPEAVGKFIAPRVWYFDPLLGVDAVSGRVGWMDSPSSGVIGFGPVLDAAQAVQRTLTQGTDATAGVEVLVGDIAGLDLARGVSVVISSVTDASGTGGFWIAVRTLTGERIGLEVVGSAPAGSDISIGPLPANTAAIAFGPAGSGSYSFTLAVTPL